MRKRTISVIAATLGLGLGALALVRIFQPARVSAREAVLTRQNQALTSLVGEAEAGTLVDFKGVLVTVDQSLVQDLVRAVLPIEADVGGGFEVRITDVESAFGAGVALVRLIGQARLGPTDVGTRVTVFAAIDVVRIDPQSGILQCDVGILAVEAENASALGMNDPVGRLTEALANGGLALLLGPLEIPVRIEDEVSVPTVQSKRLQIPGEEFPLTVTAHKVKVFGGKLWVFVDVALTPRPGEALRAPSTPAAAVAASPR